MELVMVSAVIVVKPEKIRRHERGYKLYVEWVDGGLDERSGNVAVVERMKER